MSDKHPLSDAADLSVALQRLFQQSKRELQVLASFAQPIWQQDEVLDVLARAAREKRYLQIQLLVRDARQLSHGHHPLLALAQRLSSKIKIRAVSNEENEGPDNWHDYVLVDGAQLLYLPQGEQAQAWVDYAGKLEAQRLQQRFVHYWAYSDSDPYLQRLSI